MFLKSKAGPKASFYKLSNVTNFFCRMQALKKEKRPSSIYD